MNLFKLLLLTLLLSFGTPLAGGSNVFAQSKQKPHPSQTMQKNEKTLYQGQQQIKNMNTLTHKFKEMKKNMKLHSERPNLSVPNRELYKNMEQLNQEISDITMQMTKTMEHLQVLEQNKTMKQDRDLMRETKEIKKHLRKISEEMGPTALSMERIQNRLSQKKAE
ncbi:MAG: hypothetical protein K9K67_13760 [Bacteriovoracaceae bacterium]|nr:hypothetical protein [Bacteriovoracaceae bacterium]